MVQESKYCTNMMNKHFKNKLVITKEDDEFFKNSNKCWIFDNVYVNGNVDVRDHCHITRKYRGSACRDCNINVKLNNKIPIVFHNLKNHGHISLCKNKANSILK